MRDPRTIPVLHALFTFADGSTIERGWSMLDADLPHWMKDGPPEWLLDPRRSWTRPQDPITFTGRVRVGHEAEARALLAPLPGAPG